MTGIQRVCEAARVCADGPISAQDLEVFEAVISEVLVDASPLTVLLTVRNLALDLALSERTSASVERLDAAVLR